MVYLDYFVTLKSSSDVTICDVYAIDEEL